MTGIAAARSARRSGVKGWKARARSGWGRRVRRVVRSLSPLSFSLRPAPRRSCVRFAKCADFLVFLRPRCCSRHFDASPDCNVPSCCVVLAWGVAPTRGVAPARGVLAVAWDASLVALERESWGVSAVVRGRGLFGPAGVRWLWGDPPAVLERGLVGVSDSVCRPGLGVGLPVMCGRDPFGPAGSRGPGAFEESGAFRTLEVYRAQSTEARRSRFGGSMSKGMPGLRASFKASLHPTSSFTSRP